MNPHNIFAAFVIVLVSLLHSINDRIFAPLLDPPEYDTTYSICYILTPPSVALTIDPSPPVLAPLFDPNFAPTPSHTFTGATSADRGTNNFSVDWEANLVAVIFIALLLQEVVNGFVLCTSNGFSDEVSSAIQYSHPSFPTTVPTPPTLSTFPTFPTLPALPPPPSSPSQPSTNDRSPRYLFVPPLPTFLPFSPNEDPGKDIFPSCDIHTAAPFTPVSELTRGITGMPSLPSMPILHSSSSISDEEGDHEVTTTFNGVPSVSVGLIANTAARSVQNFLDEITLALSPSPSFVTRTPPVVLNIPRNLWEDLVNACYDEEPSFWDCYPRAAPRTPVDLDDEVTDGHDEGVENDIVEPLVHAWTVDAGESPPALTSTARDVGAVESTAKSVGSSREASSRIPRFTLTPAWKKSINALISGDKKTIARTARALTSTTAISSADGVAPASSSSTPSKSDALKKLNWSEGIEQTLFAPKDNVAEKRVSEKTDVHDS